MSFSLIEIGRYIRRTGGVDDTCLVRKCQARGCQIRFDIAQDDFILIDMDCHLGSIKKCDYLFLGRDGGDSSILLAPIEMKRGKARASELLSQLRSGTEIADQLIPHLTGSRKATKVRFRPIAAYGRGLHSQERKKLRSQSYRIRFRGQIRSIGLVKCGSRISSVLKKIRETEPKR